MAMTLDGSQGITFNDASLQGAAASPFGLKNRLINGDMRIDQRAAGASVTITSTVADTYTLDRWAAYGSAASKFSVQQDAAAVTPPVGFNDYLGVTSLSAYSITSGDIFRISQFIEGYNIADLAWGTANAKTVTLSFWVRSSLTGTFGGAISNSAYNRGYPFSYTISAANTWEFKTLTITGDTTGTWLTTNGMGMRVNFSVGTGSANSGTAGAWQANGMVSSTGAVSVVGTSGATFYITGVQLEVGSTATPFERRMYTNELQLCQRYYWRFSGGAFTGIGSGAANNSTAGNAFIKHPVTMRAGPTYTNGGMNVNNSTGNYPVTSISGAYSGPDSAFLPLSVASGLTTNQAFMLTINSAGTGYLEATAEL
jgi:hypothetical protein